MTSCSEDHSSAVQRRIRNPPRFPLLRSVSSDQGSSPGSAAQITPPRSPRDWNETLRDIVDGLARICGGGSGDRRVTTFDLPAGVTSSTPTDPIHLHRRSLSGPLSDGCRYHGNGGGGSRCHGDRRCCSSKAIFVRHIETHQELDNKLFQICRHGSLTDVNRTRTSGSDRWRSLPVAGGTIEEFEAGEDDVTVENEKQEEEEENTGKEQEQRTPSFNDQHAPLSPPPPPPPPPLCPDLIQLYGGGGEGGGGDGGEVDWSGADDSLQVDVGDREPEDLVVRLRQRRHLTVESVSGGPGDRVLHDSVLSERLVSRSLLCYFHGNGLLSVVRQPATKAEEDFVGTGSTYIPVVRRNESSLELTVVLHIPDDFRFSDVIVKTVDDRLVVTGRTRPLSLPLPLPPEVDDVISCSLDAVLPSFRVFVQLPRGVDARSVCATLTGEHQLVVKGQLDASPRRNTL